MNVLAIKPLSTGCQKTFIHHESNCHGPDNKEMEDILVLVLEIKLDR